MSGALGPLMARLMDQIDEALYAMMARPGRTILTALGPALGVAALSATLGLASTAGNHIVEQFDALAATEVVIAPSVDVAPGQQRNLPENAADGVLRLNGVRAAGTLTPIEIDPTELIAVAGLAGRTSHRGGLMAASAGTLEAVRGHLSSGRWFDDGHDDRRDRVAVIGIGLARELDLGPLDRRPAVLIAGTPVTVIGILDSVGRREGLLNSATIPGGLAEELFGITSPASIVVDTEVGAAGQVASEAPYAIDPAHPESMVASLAPEPADLRANVDEDTRALFLLLGVISVVVGGLGIANTTFVSVMERRNEIGLRRALGTTRAGIVLLFLMESVCIGLLGGVTGASLGTVVVVIVSALAGWTPVLRAAIPLVGIVAGVVMGLAAGLYPAMKASRLQPMEVLRGI